MINNSGNTLFNVQGVIKQDYNLSHLTWLKVGGPAKFFFKPKDKLDLESILKQNAGKLNHFVIGAGSNLIIRDGGINGIVIKLGQNFNNIEIKENQLHIGTGCLNINLANFCKENSITGFEFLCGIPGTVGGGIAMNAGAYGSDFANIISRVEALDYLGQTINLDKDQIGFSYRSNNLPKNTIFTKAIFDINYGNDKDISQKMIFIQNSRSRTQPIKEKTCGSFFMNQDNHKAWELIEKSGMRGIRIGKAEISKMHCNFMINTGGASARDIEFLGLYVQSEVLEHTGVALKFEVKRVGEFDHYY